MNKVILIIIIGFVFVINGNMFPLENKSIITIENSLCEKNEKIYFEW